MAGEERQPPSGCGRILLSLFRRQPCPSPSPTTSSSSSPSSRKSATPAYTPQAALVVSPLQPASLNPTPYHHRQQLRHHRPNAPRRPPSIRLSSELDSYIYDHQKTKSSSTFVRASSGNVMLFGNLGNLRSSSPKGPKKGNGSNKGGGGGSRGRPSGSMPLGKTRRELSKRLEPEDLKEMGNEEYKNGRFAEAIALYDRAIALDPERAAYWSNKAAALTGLGRLIEAVAECREAVKIEPGYKKAHHRLATIFLRLGEPEKAKHHYKLSGSEATSKDIAKTKSLQTHMEKFGEARKLKDWSTMLEEAQLSVSSGADSAPQVFAAQAEALLELQKHQEADAVLIDAPTFDIEESSKFFSTVHNSFVLAVRARIGMAAGRFDEAVTLARKATQIDPSSGEAAAVFQKVQVVASARSEGNDLFKASKYAEACVAYTGGLNHASLNSVLLCNRAACLMKLGQWEKAIDDCTTALCVRPSYAKARQRRADCNIKMEKWKASLEDYETIARDMPGDEEVQKTLSNIKIQLKKLRQDDIKDSKLEATTIASVTSNDQFMQIINSPGTSVVYFFDESSESDQMMPFLKQLCRKHPSLTFLKVGDDNNRIMKSQGVSFLPAFRIYRNGSSIKAIDGYDYDTLDHTIKCLDTWRKQNPVI